MRSCLDLMPPQPRPLHRPADVTGEPKLILVVEDDPVTSELLSELFADEGYRTLQTGSAVVGLRLARRYRPDAIVLDLLLSEGSGLELLEGVKQGALTRDIPVLVISAAERLLRHPAALRADALLPKPFQLGSVTRQIERLLNRAPEPLGRRLATLSA